MKKNYSVPKTKTNSSKLRTSILAGSDGVFNGVTEGTTTGKDYTFGTRERKAISSID